MPGPEREEIVGEARRERGRGESEGGAGWRVEEAGQTEARYREASASGLLGLLDCGVPVGGRVDTVGFQSA